MKPALSRWPVKDAQGNVLAYVKSLTIHPASPQVVSATVILRRSGAELRLPWDRFEMAGEQLLVKCIDESVDAQRAWTREDVCL
jgi:hypothetical protein